MEAKGFSSFQSSRVSSWIRHGFSMDSSFHSTDFLIRNYRADGNQSNFLDAREYVRAGHLKIFS